MPFSPDMDRLIETDLPIEEIQNISRTFDREISERGDLPIDELRQIRQYIDRTVVNKLLKDTIISGIDVRLSNKLRETNKEIRTDPFKIIPRSETRSILIRDDTSNEIGNILQDQINFFDSTLLRNPSLAEGNAFIRRLNEASIAANIRVPEDLLLPNQDFSEDEEKSDDGKKPFVIRELTGDDNIRPSSIREALVEIRNMFKTGEVQFTFNPTMTETPDGMLTSDLVEQIRKSLSMDLSTSARMISPKKQTKLGSITISTIRDGRRIITIPSHAVVKDIMTLAYTLKKEAGTISDSTGILSLLITKMTDVRMILSLIESVMKRNMGAEFQLIYIPMDPVGGLFLDSSLKNIRAGKMFKGGRLLKPSGIDRPDILQRIANIPMIMFTRYS